MPILEELRRRRGQIGWASIPPKWLCAMFLFVASGAAIGLFFAAVEPSSSPFRGLGRWTGLVLGPFMALVLVGVVYVIVDIFRAARRAIMGSREKARDPDGAHETDESL